MLLSGRLLAWVPATSSPTRSVLAIAMGLPSGMEGLRFGCLRGLPRKSQPPTPRR